MCYARRQRSSWARIKLSKNRIWNILRCLISFFELDCSLLFVWVVFSFKEFTRSVLAHTSMLCTSLIVVQFSMTERPFSRFATALRDSLIIISQRFRFVNTFFKVFFKTFFGVDFVALWYVALSATRILYHTLTLSVNCEFFQIQASYTIHISFFVQKA